MRALLGNGASFSTRNTVGELPFEVVCMRRQANGYPEPNALQARRSSRRAFFYCCSFCCCCGCARCCAWAAGVTPRDLARARQELLNEAGMGGVDLAIALLADNAEAAQQQHDHAAADLATTGGDKRRASSATAGAACASAAAAQLGVRADDAQVAAATRAAENAVDAVLKAKAQKDSLRMEVTSRGASRAPVFSLSSTPLWGGEEEERFHSSGSSGRRRDVGGVAPS